MFMKTRIFAAIVGFVAATLTTQADILYQYDFNTDGAMTNSASWRAYSGGDGSASNASGLGWFGGGTEDLGPTNVYALQSGQVYMGLDLNIRENGSDTQYIYGFMNGNGNMAGRLWVHNVDATTFNFALSGGGGATSMWNQAFTVGTTYRVVLGYNAATDLHTLWVDPGTGDEATPEFSFSIATVSGVNGVFFRQSTTWGADNASWSVDDLVVASDFANAVGVVPEPGTLAFMGLGAAALLLRRKALAASR
jgi:hypothetical protein